MRLISNKEFIKHDLFSLIDVLEDDFDEIDEHLIDRITLGITERYGWLDHDDYLALCVEAL